MSVIVIGASARAAMQSLARAGLYGTAIELFGDRDLQRLATCMVCPIDDFPVAIPQLLAPLPDLPVIYTGGIENHPAVVARIASTHPLWGNSASVLDGVRDPFRLREVLKPHTPVPGLIPVHHWAPDQGKWLRKPFRSSGGRGIRFASPGESASTQHYFQEWIEGESYSAQFVRRGAGEEKLLLGITEQLIGEAWLHARPFAYCGNIGPVEFAAPVQQTLEQLGALLGHATGLRGLWGLDFILRGTTVYPLEVNPRYTAALEVLELSQGFSGMELHRDCFVETGSHLNPNPSGPATIRVGKAIYFAPNRIVFPNDGPWEAELLGPFDPWRIPAYADIPHPSSVIEQGDPVLTVFAIAPTRLQCWERLESTAGELDRHFAGTTS